MVPIPDIYLWAALGLASLLSAHAVAVITPCCCWPPTLAGSSCQTCDFSVCFPKVLADLPTLPFLSITQDLALQIHLP